MDITDLNKISQEVQKVFGYKKETISTHKGNTAWFDFTDKRISIGKVFFNSPASAKLVLLHELGHLYTTKFKDSDATSEFKANLWAMECINKLYPKSILLKRYFFKYLFICLNLENEIYKKAAQRVFKKIGVKISPTGKVTLPKKYKNWHPKKLSLDKLPRYLV